MPILHPLSRQTVTPTEVWNQAPSPLPLPLPSPPLPSLRWSELCLNSTLFWVVAAVEQDDKLLHSGNEAITPFSKILQLKRVKKIDCLSALEEIMANKLLHWIVRTRIYIWNERTFNLQMGYRITRCPLIRIQQKDIQMVQRAMSLCSWKIMTDSQTSFDYWLQTSSVFKQVLHLTWFNK